MIRTFLLCLWENAREFDDTQAWQFPSRVGRDTFCVYIEPTDETRVEVCAPYSLLSNYISCQFAFLYTRNNYCSYTSLYFRLMNRVFNICGTLSTTY